MTDSITIKALLKIIEWCKNSVVWQWLVRLDKGLLNTAQTSVLIQGLLKDDSSLWHNSKLYQLMLGFMQKLNKYSSRTRTVIVNSKINNWADDLTSAPGNCLKIFRNSYLYKITSWIIDYEH